MAGAPGQPPKAKAAVCVPAPLEPAPVLLATIKSPDSDQADPLYSSVAPVLGGPPPKAKAAV